MKKQQLTYLSPRVALLYLQNLTSQSLLQTQIQLKSRHKNYFHIFNLSSYSLDSCSLGTVGYTNFKWRGIPYSITQSIKLLSTIQNYQSKNYANAAILTVGDKQAFRFIQYVAELYWGLMGKKLGISNKEYNINQFYKLYESIDCKNPPVKVIDSFSFKNQESTFIPIVKIFSESRHNNFEEVYFHNPQHELTKYYLDKKKPLSSGIGLKYCQKRPETKHFLKPILVIGDVKIEVYSYDRLKLQKQFVCGFNTKAMQYEQSVIILKKHDLYQLTNEERFPENQQIIIEISDYCQKCKDQAKCPQCLQIIRKLGNTYTVTQIQLQKLNKKRNKEHIKSILGQF